MDDSSLIVQCYKKNRSYYKEKKYLIYSGHNDIDLLQGAAVSLTNCKAMISLAERMKDSTQHTLKETIFQSESVQNERNLRAPNKYGRRMPGWNLPHLTFSLSLTPKLTSLE